jgi:hypothetical protein
MSWCRGVVVSWCRGVFVYDDEYEHQFACVQVRFTSVKARAGEQRGGKGVRGIPFFFLSSFFLFACLHCQSQDQMTDGLPMPHLIPAGTRDRGRVIPQPLSRLTTGLWTRLRLRLPRMR